MYEPRTPRSRRPLKCRTALTQLAPLDLNTSYWTKAGWLTASPLGSLVVPPRVIPRIYTFIKKLIRYPRTKTRFWVNAQCARLITRKPLNVRMGKGKGAKVRLYTFFRGGSPIAAVSALRGGFQTRLKRFMSIRLGRPVTVYRPKLSLSSPVWSQRYRTQVNSLRQKAEEAKALLGFVRRPSLKFFFSRLFYVAWRRPRLR